MNRMENALDARDRILKLMRSRREWEETNVGRVLTEELGDFAFLYRTPFQARAFAGMQRSCESKGFPPVFRPLPYGLDAWHSERKVLALDWSRDTAPRLLSYRAGEWLTALVQLEEDHSPTELPSSFDQPRFNGLPQ